MRLFARVVIPVVLAVLCVATMSGAEPEASRKIIRMDALRIASRDFTVFVDYQRPNVVLQIATTVVAENEKFRFSSIAVSAFDVDGKEIALSQTPAKTALFSQFGATASGAYVARVNDGQVIAKVTVTYENETRSFAIEAGAGK